MEGLSSICAGLGILEEDENGNPISYSKGEYCLDNLKDLLRFMRRDDPQTREVFKQVCKWNIVGKDLIPIIEYCQDDRNLVLNAVKVLVFLTMPIEPTSDDIPQQIEYLWGLKASITFSHIVPVILSLLEGPLENLECDTFTEDDWKLVQLVLTLFRNILAIQDISTQQKAGGFATQFLSLRDKFLELLFQENVMDLLLVLSQHVGGSFGYLRQDNLLLLETFYYIFMGQEPEFIAKAHLNNSKEVEDAKISVNSLKCIMEEEERRKLTRLRNLGCSQFSGTFTRLTLDGSKTLFKGNPCSASCDALLKAHKNHRGPSKRMVWDHGRLPPTRNKLLEQLYDFINQFLSGGYNVLMQSIREDIDKEHHAVQNSDVVIFFKVAWFITSCQYHKFSTSKPNTEVDTETSINQHANSTLFRGSVCGPIAESLNESMFQVVISRWRFAFDGLKETNDTKLLSAAGSLLKIMICMLDLVLKQSPEDSMEPKTARVLLYKLFYDQTDEGMTQFLFNMIKSFNTHKQSRSDLGDLVEIVHVVIRLMENLQTHGTLRVSKKSRKKKMKKDGIDKLKGNYAAAQKEVTGYEPSEDVSMVGNKNTVDLNSGGKDNEETIQVDEPIQLEAQMEKRKNNMSEMEQGISDDIHGTDDSSGDEQPVVIDEVDFKISTLVSALGNHTIVNNLCWLLKFYKINSPRTNHCIISMLQKVSEDLELSPMLYQLSLLTTFYNILEEQKSRPCKDYENVVLFLTTLVRRMMRRMKSYSLLFVEILFWKTRKECHYINSQCLLDELGCFRKEFNENQNDFVHGETGLSGGQQWIRRSIADALGDDEADVIMSDMEVGDKDEDPNKTKFEKVAKRSKREFDEGTESSESFPDDAVNEKENDIDEKVPEGLGKRRKSFVLTTELEGKIKDLYEKYKSDENCCHLIVNALEANGERISSNQISRTLKQLGLKLLRKRTSQAGSSDQIMDSENTLLNMDKLEGSSPLRKPLHIRKRVRALSEDQEQRIKDLFEQFKDQKKCGLKIANALDAEGGVSAAQVLRKLKQLGLLVPRKKTSDSSFHLRDDDPTQVSSKGAAAVSDDETLISLKRRKTKRHSAKAKDDRPKATSNDQTTIRSDFVDEDIQNLGRSNGDFDIRRSSFGNETEKSAEIGAGEVGPATFDRASIAETEVTGISSLEQSDIAFEGKNQQVHDVLDDFEDDTTVVGSRKSIVPRRQLRMIMDLEDDE